MEAFFVTQGLPEAEQFKQTVSSLRKLIEGDVEKCLGSLVVQVTTHLEEQLKENSTIHNYEGRL